VREDLDSLGFAASKLWNVARWTCDRIWSETGTIPDDDVLKAYLKSHERYADLNAQSSQAILEQLAEAFDSWYTLRSNGDETANPPGYRKRGDDHPRSTVTFKEDGFKHDPDHNRIRLSKGSNLKKVLPSLACDGGDRDNGWMAQPAVRLFDKSTGRVAPQEQVTREPQYPTARETAPFTAQRMSSDVPFRFDGVHASMNANSSAASRRYKPGTPVMDA